MSAKRVLLCECKVNRVLPPEAIQRAMASLRRRDVDLVIAEDLCGLAARNDPSLRELLKEPLSVLACHPRAVKYLLRRMVCACGANRIELRDLREEDASSLGESLGLPTEAEPEVDRRERRITWDEDWIP